MEAGSGIVHVCGGALVGKDVSIGQNVFVGSKAVIGDSCKIQIM